MALLLKEHLLTVSPWLAKEIGLVEAIFIQQLEYWLDTDSGIVDENGTRWIYNTYESWMKQFPFIKSTSTFKRLLANLKEQELILTTAKFNKLKVDRTLFYTINDVKIQDLEEKYEQERMERRRDRRARQMQADSDKSQTKSSIGSKWTYAENQGLEAVSDKNIKGNIVKGQTSETAENSTDQNELSIGSKWTDAMGQNEPMDRVKMNQWADTSCDHSGQGLSTPSRARNNKDYTETTTKTIQTTTRTGAEARLSHADKVNASAVVPCVFSSDSMSVIAQCETLGIPRASAEMFVRQYGEENVQEKIGLLGEARKKQPISNAAGWLCTALKKNFAGSHQQEISKKIQSVTASLDLKTAITPDSDLLEMCMEQGISRDTGERFIGQYGNEKVREKIELLKMTQKTQRVANAAAWLCAALKNDYVCSPVQRMEQAKSQRMKKNIQLTTAEIEEEYKKRWSTSSIDPNSPFWKILQRHRNERAGGNVSS